MKKIFIATVLVIMAISVAFYRLHPGHFTPDYQARPQTVSTSVPALAQESMEAAPSMQFHQIAGQIALIDPQHSPFRHELNDLARSYYGLLLTYKGKYFMTADQQKAAAKAMAIARLSQMLYEAEIATISADNPAKVVISIPAYASDAASLRDFLKDALAESVGQQLASSMMSDLINRNFDFFGEHPQALELTPSNETLHGQPVYSIKHTTTGVLGAGQMVSYSLLPKSRLGSYVAFAPYLPR